MKVLNEAGEEVKKGDTIVSFRGNKATFFQVTRLPMPGKDAKVLTSDGEVYACVYNLTVRLKDDEE